jgi:uncharacterized protein with HEPN domain
MSLHSPLLSLMQMSDALRRIDRYLEGYDWSRFQEDERTQDAVIRQLEILGEASNRVPPAFRTACPAIPWRHAIALRNLLIHGYDQVHLDRIWDIVQTELPALRQALDPLIAALSQQLEPPEWER